MRNHYLHAIEERRVNDYCVAGKARCQCGQLITAIAASSAALQRLIIRRHGRHKQRVRRDAAVTP